MSLGPTLAISILFAAVTMSSASQFIFIGTNTPKGGVSRGIYRVSFDPATGTFTDPILAAEIPNPSFIVRDRGCHHLYAVNESDVIDGKPGGAATAFALDTSSGQLSALGTQVTGGGGCAHLGLDATDRMLTLISYGGGEITTFPVTPDGRIGPRTGRLTNTGQLGPNTARQEKPHPHSVTYSPDNRFAYVCDLGLDKIFLYRVNLAAATLAPAGETATAPGSGPRHSKFSADGRSFYVIDELGSTITAYTCDAASGVLTLQQTVSTLPKDFSGTNICAESASTRMAASSTVPTAGTTASLSLRATKSWVPSVWSRSCHAAVRIRGISPSPMMDPGWCAPIAIAITWCHSALIRPPGGWRRLARKPRFHRPPACCS